MVQAVNPYLNFPGNTLDAFEFYRSVFGGEFPMVLRYRDFPGNMGAPESAADAIAHIALPIGPGMLMGTDVIGEQLASFKPGNNTYIVLAPDDAGEAKWLFDRLSAGGEVEMPLQATEWAEQYGIVADRFGVQWMVNFEGQVKFGD
ncbi:MAG TPA: VOC family protein [Luteimonas sp.]|nr:VOC family protein [Luteimonas sp.]HRO26254.1 VOC family protein [Luteimonas sp.]HRP72473.1 VOC family protein [Luteimonas sp.]